MSSSDPFEDLPSDPEVAFVLLEAVFRAEYVRSIDASDNNVHFEEARFRYFGQVSAALEELELSHLIVPGTFDVDDYKEFDRLRRTIEKYVTRVKIRAGRSRSANSVKLDNNTKSKLRQLLDKIKETILLLDERDSKREALLKKVAALEAEINRDRTSLEVAGALWIGLCEKTGEGLEKLEPARKWIDSIGNLLAQAKSSEPQIPALPRAEPQKQIEHHEASDEIPF